MLVGIFTSQRCGSNLCERVMYKNGIRSFGEQFQFEESGKPIPHGAKHHKNMYPATHLHYHMKKQLPEFDYSVRVMYTQFDYYEPEDIYEKLISIGGLCDHIIILEREYYYKYTSLKIAEMSDNWVSFEQSTMDKPKPVFEPDKYVKWKRRHNHMFDMYRELFPAANDITYHGMVSSGLDIDYIIPIEWNIQLNPISDIEIPVKQVIDNNKDGKPWELFENPEVARAYI